MLGKDIAFNLVRHVTPLPESELTRICSDLGQRMLKGVGDLPRRRALVDELAGLHVSGLFGVGPHLLPRAMMEIRAPLRDQMCGLFLDGQGLLQV